MSQPWACEVCRSCPVHPRKLRFSSAKAQKSTGKRIARKRVEEEKRNEISVCVDVGCTWGPDLYLVRDEPLLAATVSTSAQEVRCRSKLSSARCHRPRGALLSRGLRSCGGAPARTAAG